MFLNAICSQWPAPYCTYQVGVSIQSFICLLKGNVQAEKCAGREIQLTAQFNCLSRCVLHFPPICDPIRSHYYFTTQYRLQIFTFHLSLIVIPLIRFRFLMRTLRSTRTALFSLGSFSFVFEQFKVRNKQENTHLANLAFLLIHKRSVNFMLHLKQFLQCSMQ